MFGLFKKKKKKNYPHSLQIYQFNTILPLPPSGGWITLSPRGKVGSITYK
jgi:hypothetical protein